MIPELGGSIFIDSGAGRLDCERFWSWEARFCVVLELGGAGSGLKKTGMPMPEAAFDSPTATLRASVGNPDSR